MLAPQNANVHWRCFSRNENYNHDIVHPILNGIQLHDHCIEIELAFHVLAPLAGLEKATNLEIAQHLSGMVESVNADYAGCAYNFDSARTHHPLFQKSDALRRCKAKYGHAPGKVSEVIIDVNDPDTPSSDCVLVYQNYLKLRVDTGIRFVHTGLKDQFRMSSGLGDKLRALKLEDPQFASKAGALIKTDQHGGSALVQGCLNVWIVDLPHDLLGFSTFPWENAGLFDGVCIATPVAGTEFYTTSNIDYRRYNGYKTLTHELAHCLGLLHVFNQDISTDPVTHVTRCKHENDDFVLDTPDQDRASQGNAYEHAKWRKDQRSSASPYQFMNFMDYTNDDCMLLFTKGQRDRMRKVLMTYRQGISKAAPHLSRNEYYDQDSRRGAEEKECKSKQSASPPSYAVKLVATSDPNVVVNQSTRVGLWINWIRSFFG